MAILTCSIEFFIGALTPSCRFLPAGQLHIRRASLSVSSLNIDAKGPIGATMKCRRLYIAYPFSASEEMESYSVGSAVAGRMYLRKGRCRELGTSSSNPHLDGGGMNSNRLTDDQLNAYRHVPVTT